MKTLLVLLAALILLFGCAIPGEAPKPPTIKELPKLPSPKPAQPPPIAAPADNGTAKNGTPALPQQNGTDANQSNSTAEPEMVQRNASDKIYEGQFDLEDQSAEPLKIHFINAGYADSVLITKGEFSMLVDNGNASLVNPYLAGIGVKKLDVLVATRDYSGAIGGMFDMLDGVDVGEFWDNGAKQSSPEYALLLEKLSLKAAAIKHPQAGDRMNVSGLGITVLNPQKERLYGNPDTDAIVLKVSNGKFCALLLNPTVQERENAIISAAGEESLRCDVMTYFKHGEGRAEASVLVDKVSARDVVISVGPNGDGLPSQTALTRLGIGKVRIWRTDVDGTVVLTNYGLREYDMEAAR